MNPYGNLASIHYQPQMIDVIESRYQSPSCATCSCLVMIELGWELLLMLS